MIYFAYGSNMSSAIMDARCSNATALGAAHLPDHRLVFNLPSVRWGGSAANIERRRGATTWGVLWDLSEEDLARLDEVEGRYDRYPLTIENHRGLPALTYRVKPDLVASPGWPHPTYLELLLAGAREHDLPESYIEVLLLQKAGRS